MYLPYGVPSYKTSFVALAHGLAARGHQVTMITSVPTHKNAVRKVISQTCMWEV
jgi:hypothetical protein